METKQNIMIVAGEASGDLHGANLVKALLAKEPGISFYGIGGKMLKECGVTLFAEAETLSVVGISEVFSKLNTILSALSLARKELKQRRPQLLILIDFPDFNLRLAKTAKKLNIPVMYYISPQLWAWRKGRIKNIRKLVDEMVVILPFESEFYRQNNVPVTFVGHPLLDVIPAHDPSLTMVDIDMAPLVGLLPGSRNEEVNRLLPIMLQAAEIVSRHIKGVRFILPVAPSLDKGKVQDMIKGVSLNITISQGNVYDVLRSAALVIAASGTVTLEAALFSVPMVIVYKMSWFSHWLAQILIKVKHFGLVNLIAGEEVVPELLQDEVSAENIAAHVLRVLSNKRERLEIYKKLIGIRSKLGSPGASARAADVALRLMDS
ncbi:MAG: lipid-A-disaccharide synthase [Pseudomonadota bacterium]